MNAKAKRRMIVVSGIIVIVVIVALAMVGSFSSAQAVTVADVASGSVPAGQKVQVSGNVVEGSTDTDEQGLSFAICDADGDGSQTLAVRYDGAASSTFGNGVTAICTGRVDDSGVLQASELVTKCPSKYESATDALSVAALLDYGEAIVGKPVKVTGMVDGAIAPIDADVRFVVGDADGGQTLPVIFEGALPDDLASGGNVVLTGALTGDGAFEATDVALSS